MTNDLPTRKTYAQNISDMMKEFFAVDDATANEISDATGVKTENTRKWLKAFEEVGLLVPGPDRKPPPRSPGRAAKTWKLAPWIKKE